MNTLISKELTMTLCMKSCVACMFASRVEFVDVDLIAKFGAATMNFAHSAALGLPTARDSAMHEELAKQQVLLPGCCSESLLFRRLMISSTVWCARPFEFFFKSTDSVRKTCIAWAFNLRQ